MHMSPGNFTQTRAASSHTHTVQKRTATFTHVLRGREWERQRSDCECRKESDSSRTHAERAGRTPPPSHCHRIMCPPPLAAVYLPPFPSHSLSSKKVSGSLSLLSAFLFLFCFGPSFVRVSNMCRQIHMYGHRSGSKLGPGFTFRLGIGKRIRIWDTAAAKCH